MSPKKIIIDCDVGTDDAQAIIMALQHQQRVQPLAITTVFGNSTVENSTRNSMRVLHFCNRLDIPVYQGCSSSLIGTPSLLSGYHGKDGFGDIPDKYPPGSSTCDPLPAPSALVKMAADNKGEITLIATGPLTNLATALKLDPDFGHNLRDCVVMGGNTTGRGNITPSAEFNFYSDPEAAHLILHHLGAPLTLVPLELCQDSSFSWEWYEKFTNLPTPLAQFIKDIEKVKVAIAESYKEMMYWTWDQLAMAGVIDDSIFLDSVNQYVTIDLHGNITRGQVVVDWRGRLNKKPNVRLVTKVDRVKYEKMLYRALGYGDD